MGVPVCEVAKGEAPVGITVPYGLVSGQKHQPAVFVMFQLSPAIKVTFQLSTKQSSVAVKGKRGHIEPYLKMILIFFDDVSEVAASAPTDEAGSRAAGLR